MPYAVHRRFLSALALPLLVTVLGSTPSARAATLTWTGFAFSWQLPQNWTGGVIPVSGDSLTFTGSPGNLTAINDAPPLSLTIQDLNFGPGNGVFTLSGSSFRLNGGITVDRTYATIIQNSITLPNSSSPTINVGAGTELLMQGNITGRGVSLVKTGSGTLRLSGNNDYTRSNGSTLGKTVIQQGSIVMESQSAIGDIGNALETDEDVTIESAGRLDLNGFQANLKMITPSSTGFVSNGYVFANASGEINFSLTGSARLSVNSPATVLINSSNSYTGTTTLHAGALVLNNANALGSTSAIMFRSGTLVYAAGSTTDYSSKFQLVDTQSKYRVDTGGQTVTFASNITGPDFIGIDSEFIKSGAGTLVLTGNNSYIDILRVTGGMVRFSTLNNLVGTGTVRLSNGGGLQWAAGSTTDISSRLFLDAGGGTLDTNGNMVTFANAIAGSGALIKTGSGFLRLTSANSHSGDTTVNGGVIVLAGPTTTRGQLGGADGSRITINSGNINLESNNAVVGTTPFGNIVITINAGGLLSTENNTTMLSEVVMNGGTIETASGGDFVNGNYIFSDGLSTAGTGKLSSIQGGTVILPTAVNVGTGDTLRMATVIMGNNNLVKNGTGTLLLTGNNTFTGGTQVNGGLIEFSSATAFGNAANKVTLNGGGLAWATGNTADISGRLNAFGAGGGVFDTNGNNVTLASAMSGAGALIKNGAGALRLTAANTYVGGTVINSGSLTVAQNNALGTGSVRVNGGTLDVEDGRAFSNDVVLAGGTYRRTVTGDLTGKVDATSDLAGGRDTTASILAGSLASQGTLVTSFSTTSAALNDSARESDVYHFVGTGTSTFVMELSLTSLEAGSKIAWLSNGIWVNAIDGNTGNTATLAMQNFDGSYSEFLTEFGGVSLAQSIGAYGYDEETHSAWAVLNHNSDFAVVPEPGTVAMLVLGGVAMLARRRRR